MQRSLTRIPFATRATLGICILLQVVWSDLMPRPGARAEALPTPPSLASLQLFSLGEPIVLSQLTALYLQAFDTQPGISIPFRDLDYGRLIGWLTRIQELDPASPYPLLMAAHQYAQVPDEKKQRQMLEFIYRAFFQDPDHRWPWLAHATVVAKHRLHDLPLALQYANAIARHARGPNVPHWAQQMPIFILEDMGESQSAKVLLGALLAEGQISDPREIHFLTQQLHALENKAQKRKGNDEISSTLSK